MFAGAGRGDLLARAGQLLDRLAGHRCQIGEPHEAVALRLLALQARPDIEPKGGSTCQVAMDALHLDAAGCARSGCVP